MAVYVSNIVIPAGEDFEQTFVIENAVANTSFDLSGCTLTSYMKKHPASKNITAEFDIEVFDAEDGVIIVSLASTATSVIKPGRYSYDVIVDNGTTKKRILEGSVLVTGGVTIL